MNIIHTYIRTHVYIYILYYIVHSCLGDLYVDRRVKNGGSNNDCRY